MKTVGQLPAGIPKETDLAKFPDSNVINETENNDGTPVVREIYGDILVNMYKLLRLAGIAPSGNEDNELNGYQIVSALKKFSNNMNDVEQQINLEGTVFSVALNLDILPNKYVFVGRAVEDALSSGVYTFKGDSATTYPLQVISDISSGDLVMVVIDQATVRAYNVKQSGGSGTPVEDLFVPFGDPLAYNDGEKIYYQSEGVLFSDLPEVFDLQSAIRLLTSDGTLLVYEMMLISGYVYCLVLAPNTLNYKFFRFSVGNLAAPIPVTMVTTPFPSGVVANDYKPHVYSDGANIYISNSTGTSANNYAINRYVIDNATGHLSLASSVSIDNAFEKTTNAVIKANKLYTFVNGILSRYDLGTGVKTLLGTYPSYLGLIFRVKENVYYSNGEVAKKWLLP